MSCYELIFNRSLIAFLLLLFVSLCVSKCARRGCLYTIGCCGFWLEYYDMSFYFSPWGKSLPSIVYMSVYLFWDTCSPCGMNSMVTSVCGKVLRFPVFYYELIFGGGLWVCLCVCACGGGWGITVHSVLWNFINREVWHALLLEVPCNLLFWIQFIC